MAQRFSAQCVPWHILIACSLIINLTLIYVYLFEFAYFFATSDYFVRLGIIFAQ